jgi:predicted ATP-dependent endonuclease of OLD family
MDLLPSLTWQGTMVGLRVEFGAIDPAKVIENFTAARNRAREAPPPIQPDTTPYQPPPRNLCDYLAENLKREFDFHYYVLDMAHFDSNLRQNAAYSPVQMTKEGGRSGKDVLASLLRVDFLDAQRHLSDNAGGGRAEDLSRCLSRYYDRNLEQQGTDYAAISALASAETMLNEHLQRVFAQTLDKVSHLGYPGLGNPRLLIKTALNPSTLLSNQEARVHYALSDPQAGTEERTLPDKYNGLGFKNLIYMVVELLDLHAQWTSTEENRPPVHLIFIEEPEAHLHAQLQQVFIRKVIDIIAVSEPEARAFKNQIVITTHSPHILYERGFKSIRYFRRQTSIAGQLSEVLNLSEFYAVTQNPTRDFLERYLKLTHCDLFFADAAVLVEGNVERLLLPHMIGRVAPRLQSACLSIIEIGGAFGHRFKTLIDFLGITTLIITDIDSVVGPAPQPTVAGVAGTLPTNPPVEPEEPEDISDEEGSAGTACMVGVQDAVSSNQALIKWIPGKRKISDLLMASTEDKTQLRTTAGGALARVTYQTEGDVTWNGVTSRLAGRTLEEAFALENLTWCQDPARADLRLRIRQSAGLTLPEMADRLHRKIKGSAFKKTDFALALLAETSETWIVPSYIASGLTWLENEITPLPVQGAQAEAQVVVP